ncbi:MAG TPA: xyloglucanase [Caulobacterales bacterium]|nr:xyloglucanase [Caulobacterales bacterium]
MRRWIGPALIGALIVLFAAPVSHAQTYVWRDVRVGGGGFVPNVVFSTAERGLAYARTDIGGVYRWDDTAQRWIALQDAMPQSNYYGAESVVADPADADTVFVAAGMYRRDAAAILRSRDRGAHWEIFPVPFRMGGNEDGRGLGERLAIDPNNSAILYFGSRHDGLQRSADSGAHWSRVDSFPIRGLGLPEPGQPTHGGVSFVVFDPASAQNAGSRTIYAGVADPGAAHVFVSTDAGLTWRPVAGEPRPDLLPVKAEMDADAMLYIAYSDGIGPNGVRDGALYKYDTHRRRWTDVTPPDRVEGGFMGLALDRRHPGTLTVASMNRWGPRDTIWRSTDAGRTWRDIRPQAQRDVSATPFLHWGEQDVSFGWWIAGLAIDPFDSNHVVYTTGATIYATHDDLAGPSLWRPWVNGVEETAVITIASPSGGPFHLLSGFGDIGGFAHEDLDVSPRLQFTNPVFNNTNTIDVAGAAPNVVVRSGVPHDRDGARLAYSTDYGRNWAPLATPSPPGDAAIVVSADGAAFIVAAPTPLVTWDRGQTWREAQGLPTQAHPIADRVNGRVFYAMDFERRRVLLSRDGGATFSAQATQGLPNDITGDRPGWREAQWPLIATPDRSGDLWFMSRSGLYHSTDGGRSFAHIDSDVGVERFAFGAPPPGRDYPALYAIAWQGQMRAIFRSDDVGRTWTRINDESHEYGRRFRCIAADPRIYGRVYVGTDGRGVVYGEPAR